MLDARDLRVNEQSERRGKSRALGRFRQTLHAERAFLRSLGAGCAVPAGAHAMLVDGVLALSAVLLAPDGERVARAQVSGRDATEVGEQAARELMSRPDVREFWSERS